MLNFFKKFEQLKTIITFYITYSDPDSDQYLYDIGFLENGYSEKLKSKAVERLKQRIPQTTKLNPNEIAETIKLILSSTSINGSVITVDQGIL